MQGICLVLAVILTLYLDFETNVGFYLSCGTTSINFLFAIHELKLALNLLNFVQGQLEEFMEDVLRPRIEKVNANVVESIKSVSFKYPKVDDELKKFFKE